MPNYSTLTVATEKVDFTDSIPSNSTDGCIYSKRNGNMWVVATGVTVDWSGDIAVYGYYNDMWILIEEVTGVSVKAADDATIIYAPDRPLVGVARLYVQANIAPVGTPEYFLMIDSRVTG
jgi:hypothetical protein